MSVCVFLWQPNELLIFPLLGVSTIPLEFQSAVLSLCTGGLSPPRPPHPPTHLFIIIFLLLLFSFILPLPSTSLSCCCFDFHIPWTLSPLSPPVFFSLFGTAQRSSRLALPVFLPRLPLSSSPFTAPDTLYPLQ